MLGPTYQQRGPRYCTMPLLSTRVLLLHVFLGNFSEMAMSSIVLLLPSRAKNNEGGGGGGVGGLVRLGMGGERHAPEQLAAAKVEQTLLLLRIRRGWDCTHRLFQQRDWERLVRMLCLLVY